MRQSTGDEARDTGDRFRYERWIWRAVARYVGIGLLVGAAILGVGVSVGAHPSAVLCLGIPPTLAAMFQLVRLTGNDLVAPERTDPVDPARTAESFIKLRALERRLEAASKDGTKFDWSVRPVLAQLATERLKHRHAINLRREPERARALLGEQLWQIVVSPQSGACTAPQSMPQISELVAAIERL